MNGQSLRTQARQRRLSDVVSGFVAVKAEVDGLDVRTVRRKRKGLSHAAQCRIALLLPVPYEQTEEKDNRSSGASKTNNLSPSPPYLKLKSFVAAFHPGFPDCVPLVGASAVLRPRHVLRIRRYGGRLLINIRWKKPDTSSSMRRAAVVIPRYAVVEIVAGGVVRSQEKRTRGLVCPAGRLACACEVPRR